MRLHIDMSFLRTWNLPLGLYVQYSQALQGKVTQSLLVQPALFIGFLLVIHLYRAKIAQIDLNIRFA